MGTYHRLFNLSKFCRFLCIMLRYLCVKFQRLTSFGWQDILIHIKVGDPRTKKNSSWNTHSIKKRPCAFLRIMISYLCEKCQSLTSLRCRDILVTDKQMDGRTDQRTPC